MYIQKNTKMFIYMVNISEIKLQKSRFIKKIVKKKLNFGDKGLIVSNFGRIELIQIFFIKKILKKLFKKRKNFVTPEFRKIWFFLEPNHIIQKKSKNSRMGKGKGTFERKIIRVQQNKILMEFKGVSLNKIKKLIFKLKNVLSIKINLLIYKNKFFTNSLWVKKNKYYYFFNKYLK